jgi:DNA-binding XRE family transcriptional regulator
VIPIDDSKDLAEAAFLLRRLGGLTQAEVATAIGVHPARISEVESGRRKVSLRVAMRHLGALGYGLAIVPLDQDGPESGLRSTETAEPPVAGGSGGPGGAHSGSEGSQAAGDWRWTPTADGGSYSGPHGPDICPRMGCRHEGGAA